MSGEETRAERIARARRELAERAAADPAAVDRINGRMARLDAARKRERERFDHLVLGKPRPAPAIPSKPAGMSKAEWKIERKRLLAAGAELEPGIEEAFQLRERWSHKTVGTPETWESAERTHQGALAQLYKNGTIDNEQLEWAAEIANVHRSIESDVAVRVASLEARVDNSGRGGHVEEGIRRVRMHLAYTYWREQLPAPKRLVLDMIVGDAIGFTVAAKRYRVHNRKAKRLLIEAINRWPECLRRAKALSLQQPSA